MMVHGCTPVAPEQYFPRWDGRRTRRSASPTRKATCILPAACGGTATDAQKRVPTRKATCILPAACGGTATDAQKRVPTRKATCILPAACEGTATDAQKRVPTIKSLYLKESTGRVVIAWLEKPAAIRCKISPSRPVRASRFGRVAEAGGEAGAAGCRLGRCSPSAGTWCAGKTARSRSSVCPRSTAAAYAAGSTNAWNRARVWLARRLSS